MTLAPWSTLVDLGTLVYRYRLLRSKIQIIILVVHIMDNHLDLELTLYAVMIMTAHQGVITSVISHGLVWLQKEYAKLHAVIIETAPISVLKSVIRVGFHQLEHAKIHRTKLHADLIIIAIKGVLRSVIRVGFHQLENAKVRF